MTEWVIASRRWKAEKLSKLLAGFADDINWEVTGVGGCEATPGDGSVKDLFVGGESLLHITTKRVSIPSIR